MKRPQTETEDEDFGPVHGGGTFLADRGYPDPDGARARMLAEGEAVARAEEEAARRLGPGTPPLPLTPGELEGFGIDPEVAARWGWPRSDAPGNGVA